ncbi:DUF2075 domain-containing protein [Photobacterium profundum]|uniref:Schlafen group 3-like DNA/RNA helicase domain-containing protein n=3 Tax=Photobacterium profundum TaxID=74109 RepID=Q1Z305_9GAMM|nr:hypothetical protein P3TCK_14253 [Photobacterium profundum 3TCK]PSV60952.1 DUF2075 domain-containing protein [Photobacterium profundum]
MASCYASKICNFIKVNEADWLHTMTSNFHHHLPGLEIGDLQKSAWQDCFKHLQSELATLADTDGYIIFEYILPMEGGRRPDVILLIENKLFILEFKMKDKFARSDIDQLKGYYRDISGYHKESIKLDIMACLVTTKSNGVLKKSDNGSHILSCDKLIEFLSSHLTGEKTLVGLNQWLDSDYHPLPTLVEAAVDIFNNNEIQELKTAKSAGVYDALNELDKVTNWVEGKVEKKGNKSQSNVLTLVTGVPGAGKTLLGLEFVHRNKKGQFLSGNGPLVDVLQYALQNNTFVNHLKNFKSEYTNNHKQAHTNIVVFDEAQRAWDLKKNKKYRKSEPECIISIADKDTRPCHYLALVGEGQEIHVGEEAGISLWNDALQKSKKSWVIFCPPELKKYFSGMDERRIRTNELLNLDESLRTHAASLYPRWVKSVLENKVEPELAHQTIQEGFSIYITRDLRKAQSYCKSRYRGTSKKYGLVASSSNIAYSQQSVGPWFHDSTISKASCCSFNRVVSEFECQGLELDMPILSWGDDFLYSNGSWELLKGNRNVNNPYQIKKNSYRVLMTRGRDGVIIYLPQDYKFNELYTYFTRAGAQQL